MRGLAAAAAGALLLALLAAAASLARTELLHRRFEQQFWEEARYPASEVLGAWHAYPRLVQDGRAHCDFAAEAVYGVSDEYEAVEAHYASRVIALGDGPPVAFDVQPVADTALVPSPPRAVDLDATAREALTRTHTDLLRAQSFHTVYIVRAVSWGHAPWLDWRCR